MFKKHLKNIDEELQAMKELLKEKHYISAVQSAVLIQKDLEKIVRKIIKIENPRI